MSSTLPDRYAVIGHPVAHSKSPMIHAAFARATGQHLTYEALLAPLDGFATTVRSFVAGGGCGCNVTVPFKLEAFALASELTPRAAQAGAVNTLKFDGATMLGDNTDGVGLVRDIERLGINVVGSRVLILGAGGAARGVIGPLLALRPERLAIAARRLPKAAELAGLFAGMAAPPIASLALDGLAGEQFDLIVNATSASLGGAVLELPAPLCARAQLVYDMMYAATSTPFLHLAAERGAALVADGLGMLVEQAAESFALWRGVRPPTAPVLAAVRAALTGGA